MSGASVTDWITAVAEIGIAATAVWQMRRLGQERGEAREAMEVTRQGVEAALSAVKEAARGRVDARASSIRVEAFYGELALLVDLHEYNIEGNFLALEGNQDQSARWKPEVQFVFPKDASRMLWLRFDGRVTNDGVAPTRVYLQGRARFRDTGRQDTVLMPGQVAAYAWWVDGTLDRWVARNTDSSLPAHEQAAIRVTSSDLAADGVADEVSVYIHARPLQPMEPREHQVWQALPLGLAQVQAHANDRVRKYKAEIQRPAQ